ncbi:centriole and centriolar satellite protein OFD1 isoform X1 [Antechinus flavipes]|uniref:centriole and centriolar satellite protein OFD1 isoform X1 n=1 Tax=Antechinus flavipes TaxID=38775 RepID=UPI002235AD56|nr:centriole and centriolar satellite protein OFD1 isoform X1 [Antechinus flavipes]XP_051840459.1 centriole and centriolar satellite protein OFD1 isoform X1 [Antechinus flavipes]XP_051840460.1 centriole and centriolar satellite protein OFD1 isoform X1 [Antechinus flavipes]
MPFETQALSQDELRKRLYQTFKNRGILDTLKTQLRNQLIHELMQPVLSGEVQPQSIPVEGSSLLVGASNSLVADHLRRCGYEYSLSVFFPESGLEKEKVFTMQDLLQLIKINPKSSFYKSLTSKIQKENQKGFLMQILMELTEYHLSRESCNMETQTSSALLPSGESLAEKFQLIDEQFADIYPQRLKLESLETKLNEYKKEIEQQLQSEMSQKLKHFKDIEMARMRMEEKRRLQKEMTELRQEFEKTHQAKSEALIFREKNAIERLQKHQEIEAKEIYVQRQGLLKDIEMVRSREVELKQRIEAFELTQKLQEEKYKNLEESVRRRELNVKSMEDAYEQRLKSELLKYQLELKEEYITRSNRLIEEEQKNKEKAMRLQEDANAINSRREELREAVNRAKDLELELDSLKGQILLVTKENQLLNEKLKDTTDYLLLKEERLELQAQIKLLKQQLEEIRNENMQLQRRSSQPSAELIALQKESKVAENARKLEQMEFEAKKQALEKRLQNEIERCSLLKNQILDYETSTRRLNMQIEDLKLQLKQTQTALENEVYRNPRSSLINRSVIDFTSDKIVPHDIYMENFLKNQLFSDAIVQSEDLLRSKYCQPVRIESASTDADLEFVANTKARVKELEKEAEYLEEAYRNYQQRVIQATRKSPSPARSHSPSLFPAVLSSSIHEKVMFAEDKFVSEQLPLSSLKDEKGDAMSDYQTPQQRRIPSPRRLSSTPRSKTRRSLSNQMYLAGNGSFVGSPCHLADKIPSPIPKTTQLSSAVSAPNISIACLPSNQEQKSSYYEKHTDQDISDFSNAEKSGIEDVQNESSLEYGGNIPKELEIDVLYPAGDMVPTNRVIDTVPTITTLHQDPIMLDLEEQETEEKWEEKRREREEKRQRERLETFEKEQRELQKLDKEMKLLEESLKSEVEKDIKELEIINKEIVNPLEKYMKIIQQNKDQESVNKSSKKEVVEEASIEETLLSDNKAERYDIPNKINTSLLYLCCGFFWLL